MALCAVADSNGVLHLQASDATNCPGAVLLSSQEYSGFVAYTTMPATSELAGAFQAGFVLPMSAYMVAYCVGRVVAVFNGD